jgi:DNA-binding CsgD family transcriptional regulator
VRSWPLVGREDELGAIGTRLDEGSGVVVAGPPGVGKTRLAAEAADLARARGCAVEWVRATRSAASIPLGAFAGLGPAGGGVEVLAALRRALVERAGGRRLVLCADDAHLLDDASAALVHQLAAAGEASVVATVVAGAPTPDAIRALWKDELCARVELGQLARGDVARLLGAALGGPLDGRSLDALWRLTLGNPLYLRELARHGGFTESGGSWSWSGEVPDGTLAELVGLRLEGLSVPEREALELVAAGGPLGTAMAGADALEARGLVERRADGRRRTVDIAHPLYAEVVRARLAPSRLEALYGRLADALAATGARRRDDALRLAVWRLEGGGGDPALLARGAALALAAFDAGLAERLARVAGSRLELGRALAAAGRAEEAAAVLAEIEARDDAERAAVAVAAARNLLWGLDRGDEADAVLRRAEAVVANPSLRHELAALRVRLVAASGRSAEALASAVPLLREAGMPAPAQLHAVLAATEGLLATGRCEAAIALASGWLPAARRHEQVMPQAEPVLDSMRGLALRLAGRLAEATTATERTYAIAVAQRSAQTLAIEASLLGLVWLVRGRVRTAARFGREGAALLRAADASGMRALAWATVAQAAAQAGDGEEAARAAAELHGASLGNKGFEPELGLARAWAAAATGEVSLARSHAREAADLARSRGQDAYEVRCLHELGRLGEPAAERLAALAPRVEGAFAPLAAAHAAARDGAALAGVAEGFAALGAMLVAAEAAAAAAAAFRGEGREASARAAAARAGVLLGECEGAHLHSAVAAEALTDREREIALLAARGLTSRDIAERLVLSVRTVDNHLQRVYRKLGVSRRQDLSGLIE